MIPRGVDLRAFRVVGIAEVVSHLETGILVARSDTTALCRALEDMLDDSNKMKKIGRARRLGNMTQRNERLNAVFCTNP